MFRRIALAVLLMACASTAWARGHWFGYAQQGGNTVSVSGFTSLTTVARTFPSSTVTVYKTGTVTLATIYADAGGTAKANPFTSGSDSSFSFYSDEPSVDITFSGTGITTGCGGAGQVSCLSTFTWSDIKGIDSTVYNVQEYGAKCDGTTDDTTAINAAITALNGTSGTLPNGGTIQLPIGDCVVSSSINLGTVGKDIIFQGTGMRSSRLVWGGAGGNPVMIVSNTAAPRMGNITLRDFGIVKLVHPVAQIAGQYGVRLPNGVPQIVNIERLSITNMANDAIHHEGNSAIVNIRGCYINTNWGYAVKLTSESGAAVQNAVISGNELFGNDGGVGIASGSSLGVTITDNDIEGNDATIASSPHNPMLDIQAANVWIRANTVSLVATAAATDAMYLNGTNITVNGGTTVINAANQIALHIGTGAVSDIVEGLQVSGCSGACAGSFGVKIEAGATDTFILRPNYANNFGTTISDAGTRTTYFGILLNGTANQTQLASVAAVPFTGVTFANLGAPVAGNIQFCTDCKNSVDNGATVGNVCANSGNGAFAVRINGTWHCY